MKLTIGRRAGCRLFIFLFILFSMIQGSYILLDGFCRGDSQRDYSKEKKKRETER